MPHLEPVLDNLFQLLQFARGAVYAGELDEHIGDDFCALCDFIRMEWPRLAARIERRRAEFTTHLDCIVIPFNQREVAYLSLTPPYAVEIKPYDRTTLAAAIQPDVDQEPGLVVKAKTLSRAMRVWASSGFQMATDEDAAARKAICEPCEFWQGGSYLGAGKCKKCGCSGVKLKLATSSCPIGKWHAVNHR